MIKKILTTLLTTILILYGDSTVAKENTSNLQYSGSYQVINDSPFYVRAGGNLSLDGSGAIIDNDNTVTSTLNSFFYDFQTSNGQKKSIISLSTGYYYTIDLKDRIRIDLEFLINEHRYQLLNKEVASSSSFQGLANLYYDLNVSAVENLYFSFGFGLGVGKGDIYIKNRKMNTFNQYITKLTLGIEYELTDHLSICYNLFFSPYIGKSIKNNNSNNKLGVGEITTLDKISTLGTKSIGSLISLKYNF